MIREIYEQSEILDKILDSTWDSIGKANVEIRKARRIFLTGSGTSLHAAMLYQILLNRTGISPVSIPASEFHYWFTKGEVFSDSVLIVFSQSGESSDALNAAGFAKELGMTVIGITNGENSELYKLSDITIYTNVGKEMALAATKSYIAQITVVLESYMLLCNKELRDSIPMINSSIREIFADEDNIRDIADRLGNHVVFLGSKLLYPTALEGALKMKESSNTISDGYAVREFIHGPKQVVGNGTSIILLDGGTATGEISKLREFGASLIDISESSESKIKIPHIDDILKPILYIVPLQMIAYYRAISKGLDPDKPDKLSKVVR